MNSSFFLSFNQSFPLFSIIFFSLFLFWFFFRFVIPFFSRSLTTKNQISLLDTKNRFLFEVKKNFFSPFQSIKITLGLNNFNFRNFGRDEFDNGQSLQDFMSLDDTVQVVTDTQVRFTDVAGNSQAKGELQEVINFLKDPSNYANVGASVPRGILLGGPPGTGKTLLAKAIAGEAKTPFLKVSGSQFVELLIGVGASRVRELFEKAYELKPSVIFIDEIDSIARARGRGMGANDEREQTLNQILTEMDGFTPNTGVVVIGATNRTDVLDPAILRPGRFDRQVTMVNPNLAEREEILQVHIRGKKIDSSVSLTQIAQRTIGFSGADLANILNEAALLATRFRKPSISMKEVNISIDRIIVGLEGRNMMRIRARHLIAFHEMGHAFVKSINEQEEGIEKVTIVPRGNAMGITWSVPSALQYTTRQRFMNQVFTSIAGRAAEEMIGGYTECGVGAQQDLYKLTRFLRTMILRYAMSRLRDMKQQQSRNDVFNLYYFENDVIEELNNIVDGFTTNLMDSVYEEVLSFLRLLRPTGERVADQLLEEEEINGQQLQFGTIEYVSQAAIKELLVGNRQYVVLNSVIKNNSSFRKAMAELIELMKNQV